MILSPAGGLSTTLWINRQAYALFHDLLGLRLEMRDALTFVPEHLPTMDEALTSRIDAAERPQPKLEELRRIIRKAGNLDGEQRTVIVVQSGPELSRQEIQSAYQEELDHTRGLKLTGGKIEGLIPCEQLRSMAPSEVAIAEQALLRAGYPDRPDYLAHEIFVRLLENGDAESLDLNPQQAGKLAGVYAKLLVETHGAPAYELGDEIAGTYRLEPPRRTPAGENEATTTHVGEPGEIQGELPAADRGGPSGRRGLESRNRPPLSAGSEESRSLTTLMDVVENPEPCHRKLFPDNDRTYQEFYRLVKARKLGPEALKQEMEKIRLEKAAATQNADSPRLDRDRPARSRP